MNSRIETAPKLSGPVKRWLIRRVPARIRPAARHWYRALFSRLDREMELLAPLLERDTIAVDVGAHEGEYTYYFASRGLFVEAFEPQRSCAALLRELGRARVNLHAIALSDYSGPARLMVPLQHGAAVTALAAVLPPSDDEQSRTLFEIRCSTLDSYNFRGVSVVKVDVEGHELAVLRGGEQTLLRDRPLLLLELERRHVGEAGWNAAVQWLRDRRYEGFFTPERGRVLPLAQFDFERHQRVVGDDLIEPYVSNILFVSRDTPDRLDRARRSWRLDS